MKITEDLVLGARFTINHTGGSLLRLFEVTGLTPGRDTLAQAAGAQDSATGSTIPRYGDPHPSAPGLFVAQIEAEPIKNSRTAARISVRYATPEASSVPNVVRVAIRGSSRAKIISTSAADGSALVVKYTDPAGNALQEFLQIPVLCPNTVLEFTRQEPRSPLRLSLSFRRSVNSTAWQGGDARTWLCRGINAALDGAIGRQYSSRLWSEPQSYSLSTPPRINGPTSARLRPLPGRRRQKAFNFLPSPSAASPATGSCEICRVRHWKSFPNPCPKDRRVED